MPGPAALSDEDEVIVVRADSPQLDAETVQNIARNFRPHVLPAALIAQLPNLTADQVTTAFCGSVNPDYYAEFLHANSDQNIPHATPLGASGGTLIWPACLRIEALPDESKAVPSPATSPFQALVGATSDQIGGATGLSILAWIRNDTPYIAVPVELQPKHGLTMDDAVSLLQSHSEGIRFSAPTSQLVGHVVEDIEPDAYNLTAEQRNACPAKAPSPFSAAAVYDAYRTSVTERPGKSASSGVANLIIVDNGFFGAGKDDPNSFSLPFPRKLFGGWADQPGRVGPEAYFGAKPIWPINYQNNFAPDKVPTEIQAHGTHVAGLSIGGPDFENDFAHLFLEDPNQASPFHLTIINLGDGEKYFVQRSQEQLDTLFKKTPGGKADLKSARIVNLSLAYDGEQAAGMLQGLFYEFPDTLFVAASGNDTSDVSANEIYPAALGTKANVISVAASDLQGNLSWFSNYGSNAVDIAAPGCGIPSWFNGDQQGSLSGTSQAAPQVSFTGSLLKTLDDSLSPWQIKSRILSTGDLLSDAKYRWNVISGSQLNVAEALLLYDDILEVKLDPPAPGAPAPTEIWLGEVTKHWGIRCVGDDSLPQGRPWSSVWAYKSDGTDHALFLGRNVDDFYRCDSATTGARGGPAPFVEFRRRAKLLPTGVVLEIAPAMETVDIGKITKLVPQGPYFDKP